MLRQFRRIIKATVPNATEKLSYGMPYYSYHGRFIYFAAFQKHCSLFVMSRDVMRKYRKELKPFQATRNTLHFPYGTPLPVTLIKKLVAAQKKVNEARATSCTSR